jgi:hypothetical protein
MTAADLPALQIVFILFFLEKYLLFVLSIMAADIPKHSIIGAR